MTTTSNRFNHVSGHDSLIRLRHHFFNMKRSNQEERQIDFDVVQSLQGVKGRVIPVKTFTADQIEEFDRARKNLEPIIIKGIAKDWKCYKEWSPEFLKERYGDTEISLLNPEMKDQSNLKATEETTKLSIIIDCLLAGDTTRYARFSNLMHIYPQLQDDVDKKWFLSRRGKLGIGEYYSLFLGAKGTKTNLHAACSNNLFCQIRGKKHWTLIAPKYDCVIKPVVSRTPYFMSHLDPDAPNLATHPGFEHIDRYECVLEEGDILYNPGSWWHKVTNLTASIGFGFRWFNPVDSFKLSPTQTLQFIGSTNPTLYRYVTQGKNFSQIIKKGHKE